MDALVLGLLVLLHVVLLIKLRVGFQASDDLGYAQLANRLLEGGFATDQTTFSHRFGVFAPVAGVYAIFGYGVIQTILWPVFCSMVSLCLAYWLGVRAFGRRTALLSGTLFAASFAQIRGASVLVPEAIVSMFQAASVCTLWVVQSRPHGLGRQVQLGILTAALLGAAFLAKLSVVWLVPVLLFWVVVDVGVRRRNGGFWGSMLAAGLLMGLGYLLLYESLGDGALARLESLAYHNNSRWSLHPDSLIALLSRLTLDPVVFLARADGYWVPLALALPLFPEIRMRMGQKTPNALPLLTTCTVSLLGCFWLGSTSFVQYQPLPLAERFLLPFLWPAAILAGVHLSRAVERLQATSKIERARFSFLTSLSSGVLLATAGLLWRKHEELPLFLSVFCILAAILPRLRQTPFLAPRILGGRPVVVPLTGLALVCLLIIEPPARLMLRGRQFGAPEVEIEAELFSPKHAGLFERPAVIFTDARSLGTVPFFFHFRMPAHLTLRQWQKLGVSEVPDGVRTLVYVHRPRARFVAIYDPEREPPDFVEAAPEDWVKLFARGDVLLYELPGAEKVSASRRRRERTPPRPRTG